MKLFKKNTFTFKYFSERIVTIFAILLVWRGIWYMLDEIDKWLFGESHFWTALFGFVLGMVLLYLPDRDLKEIEKV